MRPRSTHCRTWHRRWLTLAMLFGVLPGCASLAKPASLTQRGNHTTIQRMSSRSLSRHELAQLCQASPENCGTATANEPRELSSAH